MSCNGEEVAREEDGRAAYKLEEAQARDRQARDMELGTFDVDSFADYLFGDCDNCHPVQLREQMHNVTETDFDRWHTSDVLAVACDPGQPAKTRIAALDALISANERFRAVQREQYRQRQQALSMVQQFTRRAA